jgi:hypothetical protein
MLICAIVDLLSLSRSLAVLASPIALAVFVADDVRFRAPKRTERMMHVV